MQPDTVSVTLAVGSASWQKTLPTSLARAGMLRRLLISSPQLEIQEPNGAGSLKVIQRFPFNEFVSRVLWGASKRLPSNWRSSTVMATALLRDHYWSRSIPPCDVFHGWMGLSLKSLRRAKRQGAVTVVDNPGRHPGHFHRAPHEECDRFHISRKERSQLLPGALIERMKREYEICDCVIVPSTIAYKSFAEFGYAHKTTIVLPGVDEKFFSPRPEHGTPRPLFRACFVGRIELSKGAGYLLQAWKRLALPNAELLLIGEGRPEMKSLMQSCADSTVCATGVVSAKDLRELYSQSDVFVFPSVNEGLAQVLLEAMASGLPVVASDISGAEDCVTRGKDGFIVPGRDIDRLAEAIMWCYENREATRIMGKAARAKIESQFTLAHYDQRMIALYRQLAGATV
jgi:glycosyltransferase involved in cell wall biosynthesis